MPTAKTISDRAKDWRNGAVVYQIFVDRFTPPTKPNAKFKAWSDLPAPGKYAPELGMWTHEADRWGGDLTGINGRMDYVKSLGADVVYLTPIFAAATNHRYDTQDYRKIDPDVGTQADLDTLIKTVHGKKMKIMLDGVFNHMGKTAPVFQKAFKSPDSKYRDWFFFGPENPGGYRGWAGVANLPGLKLETKSLRDDLWNGPKSVVREYLRRGIDGWRLDVAYELGSDYLAEITKASHETKKGSAVVGEIWGYPSDWFPALDGVYNFFAMDIAQQVVTGQLSGGQAGRIYGTMVADGGIDNLLKSWLTLDNHDTERLTTQIPDLEERRLAQVLQFTLPGCPMVYYGTELGMTGGGDPGNRAPMRWDLVTDTNPDLIVYRKLAALHNRLPALKYGEFLPLETDKLLAFSRVTNLVRDAVITVINPTNQTVKELMPIRVGRIMSYGILKDELTGTEYRSSMGSLEIELKPHQAVILTPVTTQINGYSPYNRVK